MPPLSLSALSYGPNCRRLHCQSFPGGLSSRPSIFRQICSLLIITLRSPIGRTFPDTSTLAHLRHYLWFSLHISAHPVPLLLGLTGTCSLHNSRRSALGSVLQIFPCTTARRNVLTICADISHIVTLLCPALLGTIPKWHKNSSKLVFLTALCFSVTPGCHQHLEHCLLSKQMEFVQPDFQIELIPSDAKLLEIEREKLWFGGRLLAELDWQQGEIDTTALVMGRLLNILQSWRAFS